MTSAELEKWFNNLLNPGHFAAADPSKNGLQVDNSGKDINRVAFAVDACFETMERAEQAGAGMLFVHHGLFWRDPLCITGSHYKRIKKLLDADMALYASHLPLDAHPECGNNSGLVRRLGLENIELFGEYHGMLIGFRGTLPGPAKLGEITSRLFVNGQKPLHVLPFGPETVRTAGIISGGAGEDVVQAIEEGLDLFITGEISHEIYHTALENRINVIAGGHYQTETVGPGLVAERLGQETGIDTLFIDVPTGL
ncbi:Nif3-like dinuclear metal center hexameric protein [Brucepastera parasyntrophica]|uniref:Nif3-like dinuclear metal center hexameric protein n=1 Tax=Brucepastera parasyntrophica TaxID=2880008 RepID=UPI00210B2DAF|nr:Nif3-like dinuclear metal center hexameric protein [Brucepastera parasyntrophica]ULQ58975.1 Nif3-like dinuclear metal center hexameric protein [Brucepastera parasyntrophica]